MEEVKPAKGLDEGIPEPTEEAQTHDLIAAVAESNSITAVALMRVYDVLMCLYADSDPVDAKKLAQEHKDGKIRSEIPWLDLNE